MLEKVEHIQFSFPTPFYNSSFSMCCLERCSSYTHIITHITHTNPCEPFTEAPSSTVNDNGTEFSSELYYCKINRIKRIWTRLNGNMIATTTINWISDAPLHCPHKRKGTILGQFGRQQSFVENVKFISYLLLMSGDNRERNEGKPIKRNDICVVYAKSIS